MTNAPDAAHEQADSTSDVLRRFGELSTSDRHFADLCLDKEREDWEQWEREVFELALERKRLDWQEEELGPKGVRAREKQEMAAFEERLETEWEDEVRLDRIQQWFQTHQPRNPGTLKRYRQAG